MPAPHILSGAVQKAFFEHHRPTGPVDPGDIDDGVYAGDLHTRTGPQLAQGLLARSDAAGIMALVLSHEGLRAREKGHTAWGNVAYYYAGYHAAHAALCLVGHTMAYQPAKRGGASIVCGIDRLPQPPNYQVAPLVPTFTDKGRSHDVLWQVYSSVISHVPFQSQFLVATAKQDSTLRNDVNYKPKAFLRALLDAKADQTLSGLRAPPDGPQRHQSVVQLPHDAVAEHRAFARLHAWQAMRATVGVDIRLLDGPTLPANQILTNLDSFVSQHVDVTMCAHAPLSQFGQSLI